jgi:alkylation response protein AidB-like acyl-CoA dehydrogenase
MVTAAEDRHPIVAAVREFVERDVRPAARALEQADRYPHELVGGLRALGLFGALIPEAYGGLGLDTATYARVIEELCRGWMSLAGVINSHTMAALIVLHHGTDEQRRRFLPRFARGDARGGLCLTEPHAGSDVQAIRTLARRRGDEYVLSGTKMFVTNGREGNTFAVLAVTDPAASPRHRGMSCFIVEKGHPGFRVAQSLHKLGYRGVDTVELVFEDVPVPAANLVGGVEGRGFAQVMSGLEVGRINIAARCVGVARAALEASLAHAGDGEPTPLGAMATRVHAARLLTGWAAGLKDRRQRCDLEAGMAKLFASERAHEVARLALGWQGAAGASTAGDTERLYRDTPLMIVGEGTNEIQRTLIARQLVARYGETHAALVSRESEPEERRHLLLAVRQLVDKIVAPAAGALDAPGRYPAALLRELGALGVLGASVGPEWGGLGLEAAAWTAIVEELARGSGTLGAAVALHLVGARRLGAAVSRREATGAAVAGAGAATVDADRLLPGVARGDVIVCPASLVGPGRAIAANAEADLFVLSAPDEPARALLALSPRSPGVAAEPLAPGLGLRGLAGARVSFDPAVARAAPAGPRDAAVDLALALAAVSLGVAQAAFESALRYAQQRAAFGRPIAEHQAIQLKLADMATDTTAARLLLADAAAQETPAAALMARVFAADTAAAVTLEALRVHGGYGYITEFPVERYYRDAAQLLVTPTEVEAERRALGRLVAAGTSGR